MKYPSVRSENREEGSEDRLFSVSVSGFGGNKRESGRSGAQSFLGQARKISQLISIVCEVKNIS